MKITSIFSSIALSLVALPAMAQDAAAAADTGLSSRAVIGLAAALTISCCVFAGTLAQGKTAATALEGIARNPGAQKQIFTPMILCLALIESLVIYGLIIAFSLTGKM